MDCARIRTTCGRGRGLDKVTASWPNVARRAPASSRTLRRQLRERFAGCCAVCQLDTNLDAARPPNELLRALQQQLLGRCAAAARRLPGRFIGRWADAARTVRGHGLAADWSWTGYSGGHRAGHSPASARTLSVHCPDTSPDDAQMIRRTTRRTSYRMPRGHCATCCLTFM